MFFLKKFLHKFASLIVLIVLLSGMGACNKQLDMDSTRVSTEAASWDSYDDARSGLISIYGLFRAALAADNRHWVVGDLRSGDFAAVSRPDLKAVITGNLGASYELIDKLSNWRRFMQ
ncbi:MAG: hypothetical protein IPH58_18165 [Sphingobacteriales bacterium]|nr:hypothetical protein [Sphingobacteriales bacterium]